MDCIYTLLAKRCAQVTGQLLGKFRLRSFARITVLVIFIGLLVVWRWSPLGDYLTAEKLLELSQSMRQLNVSPLLVVPCLALACLFMVPLSWIIVLSGLLFGLWWGFLYAFLSGLVSGALGFILGRYLGQEVVHRFAGRRIQKLSRVVGERGVLAAIALRIVPFAPFTVQNMLAGASHIRQRDFNIGNAVGLIPSTIFILLLMSQLNVSLETPSVKSIAGLILLVVFVIIVLVVLKRWITGRIELSK